MAARARVRSFWDRIPPGTDPIWKAIGAAMSAAAVAFFSGMGWSDRSMVKVIPEVVAQGDSVLIREVRSTTAIVAGHTLALDSLRADARRSSRQIAAMSCGFEARLKGDSELPCLRYLDGRFEAAAREMLP